VREGNILWGEVFLVNNEEGIVNSGQQALGMRQFALVDRSQPLGWGRRLLSSCLGCGVVLVGGSFDYGLFLLGIGFGCGLLSTIDYRPSTIDKNNKINP
jgi:hypothetical protein